MPARRQFGWPASPGRLRETQSAPAFLVSCLHLDTAAGPGLGQKSFLTCVWKTLVRSSSTPGNPSPGLASRGKKSTTPLLFLREASWKRCEEEKKLPETLLTIYYQGINKIRPNGRFENYSRKERQKKMVVGIFLFSSSFADGFLFFWVVFLPSGRSEKFSPSVESRKKLKDFEHMLITRQCSLTSGLKWPEGLRQ